MGVIKFVVFASLILLLGQIRFHERPLAEWFQKWVFRVASHGGKEIQKTKIYAGMSEWTEDKFGIFRRQSNPQDKESKESATDSEERISASDRESIMRLLQN